MLLSITFQIFMLISPVFLSLINKYQAFHMLAIRSCKRFTRFRSSVILITCHSMMSFHCMSVDSISIRPSDSAHVHTYIKHDVSILYSNKVQTHYYMYILMTCIWCCSGSGGTYMYTRNVIMFSYNIIVVKQKLLTWLYIKYRYQDKYELKNPISRRCTTIQMYDNLKNYCLSDYSL